MKVLCAAIVWTTALAQATPEAALGTAKAIANYAGYTPAQKRIMDFELTDPPGHPAYPGFVTVQIMTNGHDLFDVSINGETGQAFDFSRCLVFDYPFLRERKYRPSSKRLDNRIAMEANGCTNFRILRKPGDEG